MSVRQRTIEEVQRLGLEVLARELGPADFVRFLQLFEVGKGNYTEERHQWLDQLDGDTIVEAILKQRAERQSHEGVVTEEEPTDSSQQG